MKKIIFVVLAMLGMISVQAQSVEGTKFFDNWSMGLNAGGISPLKGGDFIKDFRGDVGLDVTKQVTPVLGVGIEANFGINTTGASTIFDGANVSLLGKLNLMNLFAGYKGKPRVLELEAVAGTGWMHLFGDGYADNSWSCKAGLNFNFNLCSKKIWTISVKPAVVWNMDGDVKVGAANHGRFNVNYAVFELNAGLTYHFKSSNGEHHFTLVKPYDQNEVDGLNSKINSLRGELNAKSGQLNAADNTIDSLNNKMNSLTNEVAALRNTKPKVEKVHVMSSSNSLESIVTFGQGKTVVAASQLPNVERIATYMKNHKGSKVDIKGYASPEGSAAINAKIAQARAEAVKTILIKKYKIAADRINAQGQGVGDMFEEADWNRVSICTLNEVK
ncbi:MAG: OmpA family protein [Muribaculaceae bacterium]|nr:OmpA family protein [Muribaculaceae bacterium]